MRLYDLTQNSQQNKSTANKTPNFTRIQNRCERDPAIEQVHQLYLSIPTDFLLFCIRALSLKGEQWNRLLCIVFDTLYLDFFFCIWTYGIAANNKTPIYFSMWMNGTATSTQTISLPSTHMNIEYATHGKSFSSHFQSMLRGRSFTRPWCVGILLTGNRIIIYGFFFQGCVVFWVNFLKSEWDCIWFVCCDRESVFTRVYMTKGLWILAVRVQIY